MLFVSLLNASKLTPALRKKTKSKLTVCEPALARRVRQQTIVDVPSVRFKLHKEVPEPDKNVLAVPTTRKKPVVDVIVSVVLLVEKTIWLSRAKAVCKLVGTDEPSAVGVRSMMG